MLTPTEVLEQDGPLAELIKGYAVRPQQIAMAETIAGAMHAHESLICEAGTGTGKTFAYLVPVIISGRKTIVSTGTKHLQDQLYQRDLPLVQQALGMAVNIALLKGRANYLCLHRLRLLETDGRYLARQSLAKLGAIRLWSQRTDSGDLTELGDLPENSPLRPAVTSTTENCLGQECEFFDDCFVFRARRRAADADVTIVNHHLLLADMALRERGYGELLPTADTIIFDEAHQLAELASQFFSQTLSSYQFLELIRDSKAAYFAEAADLPEFLESLDKIDKAVRDLRLVLGKEDNRLAWTALREIQEVMDAVTDLQDKAYDIHLILEAFADRGKSLDNCFKRLDGMLTMLDYFLERTLDMHIQWVEIRGQGFLFHQTPLDIAETFQTRLAEYDCQAVYTSATLAVNNDFRYFAGRLGLDDVRSTAWSSPFDFKQQTLLYLPAGLPDPRQNAFTERVIDVAVPVLKLTQGRAFLLFTSHRALQIAAELIRDKIDFPILIQGAAPRTELLDIFRHTEHAVLLGTSSFWEGVDVKGQALSCVIIDKLPFAAPDDPVLQARMKKMEEQGRNPFMEYQLPEAVITLKQGIGRLIRDKNDYGVLMICDPRLKTKSYGGMFLKSLPEMPHTSELADVESFFARFEN